MPFNIIRNIVAKFAHPRRSSASTGPFRLVPQELLDIIMCHLADDNPALLLWALVHPTWTSISRYHMPRVTLIVSSPSRSKELAKLLRSSRETLSSSIAGLTLVGDAPFNDSAMNGKSPCASLYCKLLQVIKAKHVVLCSGAVENDPSLVGFFAQYFPALTKLKVTCTLYQDITGFMRALSGSFPCLSGLSIELGSGGMDVPESGCFTFWVAQHRIGHAAPAHTTCC